MILWVFLIYGMLLVEIIDRGVNYMRMCYKFWVDDFLVENVDIVISNFVDYKGKWNIVFGNDNLIYIEVGIGKG